MADKRVKLCRGSIFDKLGEPNSMLVFPANAQVSDKGFNMPEYPGFAHQRRLSRLCGRAICKKHKSGRVFFGFVKVLEKFGLFQVRLGRGYPLSTALVELSARELGECARANLKLRIHMVYPDIHKERQIREILSILSSYLGDVPNVCIWLEDV